MSEWVWSKETHVCTHECLQFCRAWDRACMQLAVNTLVRIIWAVVPLAAAAQAALDSVVCAAQKHADDYLVSISEGAHNQSTLRWLKAHRERYNGPA